MDFTSVNIQGNIISSEILDKIRNEDIKYQGSESFGLSKAASIRDEIGMAWSVLRSHWSAYKKRLESLPKNKTGTSLTREKWILPFLTELGYELSFERKDIIVNDKGYSISHQAINRDNFPVLIMGYNDDLDKRRESGGPKQSPHSLVQEYLNHTEHLYALITNGKQLRLLRDATRLVRLSYLEFDLEKIMEEELYSDFALLYRTLHASRMPETYMDGENAIIIEYYHQESLASGSRIREKLSEAVEGSIRTLANGFLKHPSNDVLRVQFEEKVINEHDYYLYLLRLIYRILFLIVIEERKLIYPDKTDEDLSRLRKIYFQFYSVERIRKLAEQKAYVDGDKHDLWQGLVTTFQIFENEYYGKKLGIAPLGSGLFSPSAIGPLHDLLITNQDLLTVIRSLTTFYDDRKQLVRVNYSDLDVEEFGSVYEGLLEYDPHVDLVAGQWSFSFVEGDGRSSSGSHYTPEELVKPLIKHSLDYIIEDKLKEEDPESALLSIRVCDVACGSGHILLSAARRIATELAGHRENAEQPSPPYYRAAIRDVIMSCIYGVDLNPLAVELCKVALWLEAHNPGEPLNFLDHHIKCGNAIVGLAHLEELNNGIADEAFKTLSGDGRRKDNRLRRENQQERKNRLGQAQLNAILRKLVDENVRPMVDQLKALNQLPEHTPVEITEKAKKYQALMQGKGWWRLKQLADIQVAQFFLDADDAEYITDGQYFQYLMSSQAIQSRGAAQAVAKASEKRFFHWFLEFPEVFASNKNAGPDESSARGGFDCMMGNPPFLGGQKLSGTYGNNFLEFLKYTYQPIGAVDLVTYFFRRIFDIVKPGGFQSLISTNTIAQGRAREDGLDVICSSGGAINHAVKSMKWPGIAAVEVALVTITKKAWKGPFVLAGREVATITPYLDNSEILGNPYPLKDNEGRSFQGSIVLGKGFVLEPEIAKELIDKSSKNKDVLFPYLIGDDINNNPEQKPGRWVINFHDWPLTRFTESEWKKIDIKEKENINNRIFKGQLIKKAPYWFGGEVATDYHDCIEIVTLLVKPEREKVTYSKNALEYWWLFERLRIDLYTNIKNRDHVLSSCRVSKYVNHSLIPSGFIYDVGTNIVDRTSVHDYTVLQSGLHNEWAWKYASTLESRIRYLNVDCIDTFPFPDNLPLLEVIGINYHEQRRLVMLHMQLGLTKTYNLFHLQFLTSIDIEKQSKQAREVCEQAYHDIIKLRVLHKEMDEAVLDTYGWSDIDLKHDFYEVDYLPENDRIRYTIYPEARKEVLKRLLLLNHERWEDEAKQGLHDKKTVEKFYAEKGESIPPEVQVHLQKGKMRKIKQPLPMAAEDQPTYKTRKKKIPENQVGMFASEEPVSRNKEVTINSRLEVQNLTQDKTFHFIITADDKSGQQVIGHQNIKITSQLALAMINRKVGYRFKLGVDEFEILNVE